MKLEELLSVLGDFGKFQKIRVLLICIFALVCAWHSLNKVFVGATPEFQCKISDINVSLEVTKESITEQEKGQLLIPPDENCHHYDIGETLDLWRLANYSISSIPGNHTRKKVSCSRGYEYSKDLYKETMPSEFNLVCGSRIWMTTSKSVFFAGRLLGALIFGQLSDRFGRRPMFFVGVIMLLIVGTGAAFAPNLYVFLPMYFCQGAAFTGTYLVSFIMATELVGPRYRVLVSFFNQIFYSFGYMTLAGIAFIIRDWRYIEIAITAPVLLFGLYYWFLPESVSWLLSQGRDEEAGNILRKVADQNNVIIKDDVIESLKQEQTVTTSRKYNFLDCVRTWRMAKLSLNIWFNWLVCAMVYYGLSLNTSNLGGNPYLNFCIAGAVEIPAYIICILLLNRVGRRWPLVISMCVGGIACILSGVLSSGEKDVDVGVIVLAMIGKFGITASYAIIYLLAAELFPTVVRNIGMGVASMAARIGGITAPYILELSSISPPLPLVVFGSLSIAAGVLALFLPETMGKPLPQTIEDIKTQKSCSTLHCCSRNDDVTDSHEFTHTEKNGLDTNC